MCRVCILTPEGRGAVATVAARGRSAAEIVAAKFRAMSDKPFEQTAKGQIVFGRWGNDKLSGEEVVVALHSADHIEIHCHGGTAACSAIAASLIGNGCTLVSQEEWLRSKELDPIAIAARLALVDARTQKAATILLDQWKGALRQQVQGVIHAIDGQDRKNDERRKDAAVDLQSLVERSRLGMHLTNPWKVVLAGRPNVGKSSLINAILGYQRSIVFDQPGTTRDVVTADTAIAGWPVELSDTAGLRNVAESIESTGVALAQELVAHADVALLIFDNSSPWTIDDQCLVDSWPNALRVFNKCDLTPARQIDGRPAGFCVSAASGDNVDGLIDVIGERLAPTALEPGDAVPFTVDQVNQLNAALVCLQQHDSVGAVQKLRTMLA